MHHPSADEFAQLAREYDFVPVYRRLLSDALTPVTAFTLLDDGGPAFLIESVIGGEKVGRYSFLGSKPLARFAAKAKTITQTDMVTGETVTSQSDDPLDEFRKRFHDRTATVDALPPFIGGAIGYAGYDVVRYVEDLPDTTQDDRDLPDLDFAFYHTLCVFDHVDKTITVVSLADCRGISAEPSSTDDSAPHANQTNSGSDKQSRLAAQHTDPAAAFAEAAAEVDRTIESLNQPLPHQCEEILDADQSQRLPVESNFTRDSFCDAVRTCVEYIRAGDVFQVVPSQRLTVRSDVDPFAVYRSLRVVNPSPFMFFVRTPECVLVGCSPEIMCRVKDGMVTVRPLAGTRPRGASEAEDVALEKELLADPKERAEHVMLVDLGRNDIGRVAQFGSVELTEVMVIERYSHVMHISSEVRGQLRKGLDAFDALKACLPAGTVSGAPKVRAMAVIDEIEPHRRGPYGGAVGYIDYRGNMDTCLALRTIVFQNNAYHVQAGCGVVADSDPDKEYEETLNKARALIAAIEWTIARQQNRQTALS
ncbi:anthranilate synthase component I [Allorhodopirellula heiligendammensis]|uniref:Anthranilate synthase component 1 n=1 Tax=Allorhodopirellula heiligendammensis TaxID=2714739 RepID=A0A5C6BFD2_9BACT|nr:anthranilate synthase component I [Allorhodopirellula heiligendammensis]TWU10201.1 Anthranilate synthase component 1 [Allorhodopirellula heiligendammensis]